MGAIYEDYDIVSCEQHVEEWQFEVAATVDMHDYTREQTQWCTDNGLEYYVDYDVITFRIRGRNVNSHRWFFKDGGIAIMFKIKFSEHSNGKL